MTHNPKLIAELSAILLSQILSRYSTEEGATYGVITMDDIKESVDAARKICRYIDESDPNKLSVMTPPSEVPVITYNTCSCTVRGCNCTGCVPS